MLPECGGYSQVVVERLVYCEETNTLTARKEGSRYRTCWEEIHREGIEANDKAEDARYVREAAKQLGRHNEERAVKLRGLAASFDLKSGSDDGEQ